jgi:uncharacterized membrane protein YfcA
VFFIIIISSFLASLLTLFSGFGLGTLLMPVIAIFFPVPVAIAITAFVHLLNNLFKLILLKNHIDWHITLKFGLPALLATIPGAALLSYLSALAPLKSYVIFHLTATISPVKITAGILLLIFATIELYGAGKSLILNPKWLPAGGILSGFFGGLSGQQGAFRTSFLLHAGVSKEVFVGTNAAIASLVDIPRLFLYVTIFHHLLDTNLKSSLLIAAAVAAFVGSILGVIGLKKTTFTLLQYWVTIFLYLLSILLLLGII